MALSPDVKNRLAYVVIALAAVIGVWYVGHDASSDLKTQINNVVSELCENNIPHLKAENALRDAQIAINEDAEILNLSLGETGRAALNARSIAALKEAKRDVPTVEECQRDIIP